MPGVLGRLFDGCTSAHDDQIGERDLFAAGLRAVEVLLDLFENLQHLCQFRRVVYFPILLWREADPRPVSAAALVGATEARPRRPGGGDQLRDG